jgi:hypothetical protein
MKVTLTSYLPPTVPARLYCSSVSRTKDALIEMIIASFGMSMPPSLILAGLLFAAVPYERSLALEKAAHVKLHYPILFGALAIIALALTGCSGYQSNAFLGYPYDGSTAAWGYNMP